jgi:uncharacterized protein GlcG (DUF336 family)
MNRILSTGLAFALMAVPALAQQAAAPKGAAGVAAPVNITPETTIPLAQAVDAAQTAIDTCLKLAKPSAAVAQVFDLNGNAKVQLAADGAGLPFFDYARRKAYTVFKTGMTSGEFGKLPDVAAVPRGQTIRGDADLIPWAGALPIVKGGKTIGVISVSGPTGMVDDEACAKAGLAKIHF